MNTFAENIEMKNLLLCLIGASLLLANLKINENLFSDGLHPNTEGYELLGKALSNLLKK